MGGQFPSVGGLEPWKTSPQGKIKQEKWVATPKTLAPPNTLTILILLHNITFGELSETLSIRHPLTPPVSEDRYCRVKAI